MGSRKKFIGQEFLHIFFLKNKFFVLHIYRIGMSHIEYFKNQIDFLRFNSFFAVDLLSILILKHPVILTHTHYNYAYYCTKIGQTFFLSAKIGQARQGRLGC
jgi:hypothetical protein